MLSYAFTTLRQNEFEDITTEDFDNVQNLFASILEKGIAKQLKQGLYREYELKQAGLTTLRGKIEMGGTIRYSLAKRRVLSCEYDELSENNFLNQILKTTVMLFIRQSGIKAEYKIKLKKEMLFFSNVNELDTKRIYWSGLCFKSNSRAYQMLIGICKLIIEGMLLTTEEGKYKLATFIDEQRMSRLYEKFILEYYKKEWPQVKASASQIPWALDDGYSQMLPVMQTDITLEQRDKVLIIDAKYYTNTLQKYYEVQTLHSNNMYQIYAYVKNKETQLNDRPHEVSGMLLYARTQEKIQPDNTYHMSGNKISVRTLDLSRDFSKIAEQLDGIVEEYFD